MKAEIASLLINSDMAPEEKRQQIAFLIMDDIASNGLSFEQKQSVAQHALDCADLLIETFTGATI